MHVNPGFIKLVQHACKSSGLYFVTSLHHWYLELAIRGVQLCCVNDINQIRQAIWIGALPGLGYCDGLLRLLVGIT